MNSFSLNKTKVNQKDIEKGQKIVAAIYLITSHLKDSEPIRQTLRELSISFVCAFSVEQRSILSQIEMLLGSAVLSGLISEKNSSIIVYEAKHFCDAGHSESMLSHLEELFESNNSHHIKEQISIKDIKRTSYNGLLRSDQRPLQTLSETKSFSKNTVNKDMISNHSNRQDKILSFINERKSAVIKDIVSLFPEVSEKTIQRELNTLINDGRITKRGSKRWSMYMAVNSLL